MNDSAIHFEVINTRWKTQQRTCDILMY